MQDKCAYNSVPYRNYQWHIDLGWSRIRNSPTYFATYLGIYRIPSRVLPRSVITCPLADLSVANLFMKFTNQVYRFPRSCVYLSCLPRNWLKTSSQLISVRDCLIRGVIYLMNSVQNFKLFKLAPILSPCVHTRLLRTRFVVLQTWVHWASRLVCSAPSHRRRQKPLRRSLGQLWLAGLFREPFLLF